MGGYDIDIKNIHKILLLMEYQSLNLRGKSIVGDTFKVQYNTIYIPSIKHGIVFVDDYHIIDKKVRLPCQSKINNVNDMNFIITSYKLYHMLDHKSLNTIILSILPNILDKEFIQTSDLRMRKFV